MKNIKSIAATLSTVVLTIATLIGTLFVVCVTNNVSMTIDFIIPGTVSVTIMVATLIVLVHLAIIKLCHHIKTETAYKSLLRTAISTCDESESEIRYKSYSDLAKRIVFTINPSGYKRFAVINEIALEEMLYSVETAADQMAERYCKLNRHINERLIKKALIREYCVIARQWNIDIWA